MWTQQVNLMIGLIITVKLINGEAPPLETSPEPAPGLEIKYTALVFRHGDRTPIDPYPKDPWNNRKYWPVKFGQLTYKGVGQQFATGQYFRKRYEKLLSDQYDPDEIRVVSTEVDRTIMSAEANLAGLFPAKGIAIWNSTFKWNPVPVHYLPREEDAVLAMTKKCLAYDRELEYFFASNDYQLKLKSLKGLMSFLTQNTGKYIKDFFDLEYIYNTLFIEQLYNFTLPSWTADVFPDKMTEAALYSFIIPTATPKLAYLKVGPFMKVLTDDMKNAIQDPKSALKMKMYSAHDNTIVNILNAMGLYQPHFPSYTATIHFELVYDAATEQHSVRVLYRGSSELVEPVVLEIPDCGAICPIDSFLEHYYKLILNNWEYECNKKEFTILTNICLGLSIFMLIVLVHVFVFHLRRIRCPVVRQRRVVPKPPEYEPPPAYVPPPAYSTLMFANAVTDHASTGEVPLLSVTDEVSPNSGSDATRAPAMDTTLEMDTDTLTNVPLVPSVAAAPEIALAEGITVVEDVALGLNVTNPESAVAVDVTEERASDRDD